MEEEIRQSHLGLPKDSDPKDDPKETKVEEPDPEELEEEDDGFGDRPPTVEE